MKYLVVHSIMKEISSLQDLKIIHAKFGKKLILRLKNDYFHIYINLYIFIKFFMNVMA